MLVQSQSGSRASACRRLQIPAPMNSRQLNRIERLPLAPPQASLAKSSLHSTCWNFWCRHARGTLPASDLIGALAGPAPRLSVEVGIAPPPRAPPSEPSGDYYESRSMAAALTSSIAAIITNTGIALVTSRIRIPIQYGLRFNASH